MKNFLIVISCVLIFSCQKKESKSASEIKEVLPVAKNTETENKQIGDTIFMRFKSENNLYTAEGSIDSIHSKIYVKFENEDSDKLNAKIIPTTGKGNIRFNQTIAPDGSSDGPYGMDLNIDLKQKGNYILIIGHSQMADNPYLGKFKVELQKSKSN